MGVVIAVDIGGTFTDLLGCDDEGRLFSAKSSSTPGDLVRAIQECLRRVGLTAAQIATCVHGSTVAINTVIERNGARTALFVTRGTRDVYRIGRGNRPEAYDLAFARPEPLVPRHLTFEVDERIDAAGRILRPLERAGADAAGRLAADAGVEAAAVCLLHAWNNPAHESGLGPALRERLPDAFVTLSHEILREYGEYERISTTVLNAYIGPTVQAYLRQLERVLQDDGFEGALFIMQSNGGVMAPSTAQALPVATLESGPVGGFTAAAHVGKALGLADVIAFDMGGTTAKANLVRNGEPQMAHGYFIGGYASGQPMMLPVVDTVEVGSGGGSIARVDEVGTLRVGPHSAGAVPGPACYGQGGNDPTVTDANVVLGRIDPHGLLGGEMRLDVVAAREAVRRKVAGPLGLTEVEAALAIVAVAVMRMSLAVRQVSVERGYDPRDFALVAFGGAGPLHAAEIARSLHVSTLVVPNFPGQFSAAGMLIADLRHDYVRTYYRALPDTDFGEVAALARELIALGRERLRRERLDPSLASFACFLDTRYAGQDFSIPVPIEPDAFEADQGAALQTAFDRLHERNFGYAHAGRPLEIVNVRVTSRGTARSGTLPPAPATGLGSAPEWRRVIFQRDVTVDRCPIYRRETLGPGTRIDGPAVIQEYASTTLLFPADRAEVAATGELVISLGAS